MSDFSLNSTYYLSIILNGILITKHEHPLNFKHLII